MTIRRRALAAEVRRLAVPAILHSLLQTLVFVIDRVMLGAHGEASLAAMQLGGGVEWSVWSVFAAFEVGTIARVGRHVGAGEPGLARRAALLSLGAALGIGGLLTAATPALLLVLPKMAPNVSPAAIEEARRYLSVTIAASPVVFASMIAVATLQAGGDTRTPLAIGIFANLLHVALNRVLILGAAGVVPALGARGAAISTAITFTLEAGLAIFALTSRRRPVSLLGPRAGGALGDEARAIVRVAVPAFLERLLYHGGYVVYVLLIVSLGDVAMAANQSLISIESICFLSGDGFGIAAAALVAQKLGAERPEEARGASWIATRYAVVTLTAFGLLMLGLRRIVVPAFSDDPSVIAEGLRAMPVVAAAQPFMAAGIVLAQALRGAGRTREALFVGAIGAVVVRVGASYVFALTLGLGLSGAWLGSTVDWIVRTVLLLALLLRRSGRIGG